MVPNMITICQSMFQFILDGFDITSSTQRPGYADIFKCSLSSGSLAPAGVSGAVWPTVLVPAAPSTSFAIDNVLDHGTKHAPPLTSRNSRGGGRAPPTLFLSSRDAHNPCVLPSCSSGLVTCLRYCAGTPGVDTCQPCCAERAVDCTLQHKSENNQNLTGAVCDEVGACFIVTPLPIGLPENTKLRSCNKGSQPPTVLRSPWIELKFIRDGPDFPTLQALTIITLMLNNGGLKKTTGDFKA